jgi:trehalose 6-phosphate synthase
MSPSANDRSSVVVVANRLPLQRLDEDDEGEANWATSPGGLVSALAPALARSQRIDWVGWAGDVDDDPEQSLVLDGMTLHPVPITAEEKRLHYDGMSNGTLWPLYHDKIASPEFHRSWYDGYRRINQRFAEAAAKVAPPESLVWVHDYQLQLVPAMLRELRSDLRIGFFLHIPFPPAELYRQLPWRKALTEGLLGSDLVGFQTPVGADNFFRLALGLDLVTRAGPTTLHYEERDVEVRAFPIGIDAARFDEGARSHDVTEATRDLRASMGQPHVMLLGVDRLDYTKGIDVRLRAFSELLAEDRLHPSQVTMVQVAEPSRDDVEAYITLRAQVEQLVGQINGDFGRVGFPVVHYVHQSQDHEALLSLYRAADVMLVTPFRDGMNLVAKEYVATRYDETGVLVLSEFAGAAHLMPSAVLVNPYDIEGVKTAIAEAVAMPADERRVRMRELRASVELNDAAAWAESFLDLLLDPGPSADEPLG